MATTPSCWLRINSRCTPSAAREKVFDVEITDSRDGFISFMVHGQFAWDSFQYESGGHRWQRVPPTDKRGRMQTSTVTVAVLDVPPPTVLVIRPQDLEWAFSRGSGAGGQNRNKTDSAVDLTHRPTKVTVHCETERSQLQNKAIAMEMLRARLWSAQRDQEKSQQDSARRKQLGTGARGDKSWTVRTQDDTVTYNGTGQKFRLRAYLQGDYEIIG